MKLPLATAKRGEIRGPIMEIEKKWNFTDSQAAERETASTLKTRSGHLESVISRIVGKENVTVTRTLAKNTTGRWKSRVPHTAPR